MKSPRLTKHRQRKNALFFISLKIILRDKNGAVLLLKAKKTSTLAGYYDLPGGRIREGEEKDPLSKTIRRELQEEIGRVRYKLKPDIVAVSRHFYISKKTNIKQNLFWILFEADYEGGQIKISNEHVAYKWVRLTKKNIYTYLTEGSLEGIQSYFRRKPYVPPR